MSSNKHKHKVNEYHPYEEYVYDNMFFVPTMIFKLFDRCNQTTKHLELPINCYILEHKHTF